MSTRGGLAVALSALAPLAAQADITYDAAQRTLCVTGFSQEAPGTLKDVLGANDRAGWGVVAYDAGTQTFTVKAHLVIGKDDGSSTWVRVGTADRPQEVLAISGDLRVTSPKAAPASHGCNALWIGEAESPQIRPTVRFGCQSDQQFGLMVGDGTDLRIHHALLTVATPDRGHMARCTVLSPDVQAADSTLAWLVPAAPASGLLQLTRSVDRVVFEHGTVALCNGLRWARDCVFRDMDAGVLDAGCLDAILTRCRFEGNRQDWALSCTDQGIVATDCTFDPLPGGKPPVTRWRNPQTGHWQYPRFVALRHVVIEVQDEAGKPVPGALVEVTESSGDASAVHHGLAKTDAEGRTAAPEAGGALLLADYAYRATDDPPGGSSECRVASYDYRYTVQVTAEGYQPTLLREVDPDQSWAEKVVTLRRQ